MFVKPLTRSTNKEDDVTMNRQEMTHKIRISKYITGSTNRTHDSGISDMVDDWEEPDYDSGIDETKVSKIVYVRVKYRFYVW
jgi:hypothetical protein